MKTFIAKVRNEKGEQHTIISNYNNMEDFILDLGHNGYKVVRKNIMEINSTVYTKDGILNLK
jgi:hypothetical protein